MSNQIGLFEAPKDTSSMPSDDPTTKRGASQRQQNAQAPLAFRMRPERASDFFGQEHIKKAHPEIFSGDFHGLILWGPPGCGKTTLARLLALESGRDLVSFNAVLGGVADLKKLISSIKDVERDLGRESLLFVDEIHRFNKAQQDALLPYVESGEISFVGATTENPRVSVNKALQSRCQILELKPLSSVELFGLLKRACEKESISLTDDLLTIMANESSGDARFALGLLEKASTRKGEMTKDALYALIKESARNYDKNGDRHYDVISAFIKSMRGSDPDAAILWLAVMLDGGEDPVFIARRLVIFASEDVGNADPGALSLAIAALQSVQNIGMPEARIALAQATTYLASTVKSNAAYLSINEALEFVSSRGNTLVPEHLKNQSREKERAPYLYPHDYPEHFVSQQYAPKGTPHFYRPTQMGREKNILERLRALWPSKY